MMICFVAWFWGVHLEKYLVVAVDRRCLFSKWDCLEFLEVVNVLQKYDVLCEARFLEGSPIFYWQPRCW